MKKCTLPTKPLLFVLPFLVLLVSGCVLPSSPSRLPPIDDDSLPPIASFADDIQDIVMPVEMAWDRSRSMAIKTESFHGGVWHYAGKVEPISLKDYMVSAMQDAKWKLVGEAASTDIMFAFIKPYKTCMMIISEGDFGRTGLTLYVTNDKTASLRLNPFGEAVGGERQKAQQLQNEQHLQND